MRLIVEVNAFEHAWLHSNTGVPEKKPHMLLISNLTEKSLHTDAYGSCWSNLGVCRAIIHGCTADTRFSKMLRCTSNSVVHVHRSAPPCKLILCDVYLLVWLSENMHTSPSLCIFAGKPRKKVRVISILG